MSFRSSLLTSAAVLAITLSPMAAAAQSLDDVGIEVLQLLVDEGVIPFEKAQAILDKAHQKAAMKKEAEKSAGAAGVVNVPYVPEVTREQIKEEIRNEVMATAKTEGWVAPNVLPEWTKRIEISGDLRARTQYDNFADGNFPTFPDVNAINEQGGTFAGNAPILNSTEDRQRFRYRARLNVDAQVTDNVKVGVRIASGDSDSAISTNSTFGDYFAKDPIWIDRAYADIEFYDGLHFVAGRMPNPFYSTSMVWDGDINPEGLAIYGDHDIEDVGTVFGAAGVFPLEERELFEDIYLYAAQAGFKGDINSDVRAKGGLAYYLYQDIQSVKNPPGGSRLNDWTAPQHLSKGNSIFNMRTDGLTELAGLASEYELLALTGEVAYREGPLEFKFTGEVVKNLAAIEKGELDQIRGEPGVEPGDLGWLVRFDAGYPVITEAMQWSVGAGYRHVETDAVLDVFTDSDFSLGGTDTEGYELTGALGIYDNTYVRATWYSADSINRAPFSVDTVQLDLNVNF